MEREKPEKIAKFIERVIKVGAILKINSTRRRKNQKGQNNQKKWNVRQMT